MAECRNCGKTGLKFPENWVKGMPVVLIDPQSDLPHKCDMFDILRFRGTNRCTMTRVCSYCKTEYGIEIGCCPQCFVKVQYLVKGKIERLVDETGHVTIKVIHYEEKDWYWETTTMDVDEVKWKIANQTGEYRLT